MPAIQKRCFLQDQQTITSIHPSVVHHKCETCSETIPLWSEAAPRPLPPSVTLYKKQGGDEEKGGEKPSRQAAGGRHINRKAPTQQLSIVVHPCLCSLSGGNLSCLPSWSFTGLLFNELKEEIELTHNDNHPVCLQINFPTSFVVSVFKRVRFFKAGICPHIYMYTVPSTARAPCWEKSLYPIKTGKIIKIMSVLPLYTSLR